jgi:predicted MarR family transcription regulator
MSDRGLDTVARGLSPHQRIVLRHMRRERTPRKAADIADRVQPELDKRSVQNALTALRKRGLIVRVPPAMWHINLDGVNVARVLTRGSGD